MAIHKRAPHPTLPGQHVHLVMPAFSFGPNDALAQMIVDAWKNPGKLLERDRATHLPTKAAVADATNRVKKAGCCCGVELHNGHGPEGDAKDIARIKEILRQWTKNKVLATEQRTGDDRRSRAFYVPGSFQPELPTNGFADDELTIQ